MRKDSIVFRIVLSAVIIIILIIPLTMIQSLITDRQKYRNTAVQEINNSWAANQTIAGPIIASAYQEWIEDQKGEKVLNRKVYYILPEQLNIETEVFPEERYRGIYEVTLYKADIKITGAFDFSTIPNVTSDVLTDKSTENTLLFNISDSKGIDENIILDWNGVKMDVNPGLKYTSVFRNGFSSEVKFMKGNKKYNFEILLKLKGSENLSFIPLGKITKVSMKSKWGNPSFIGNYIPSARSLTSKGFNAEWRINQFNRNYPQVWNNYTYNVYPSSFGVKFIIPVDEYQKTMRTSKYGIMILLLTFVIFFMIEIFNKKAIHPIQYLLIGFALVIFYSLLLAISEYMLFGYSYLISSLLVITLISFYTASVYSKTKIGLIIGGILILFYGFMYTILQLQDYSLLLGNIALFLVLAGIMYTTRKINWYEVFNNVNNNPSK